MADVEANVPPGSAERLTPLASSPMSLASSPSLPTPTPSVVEWEEAGSPGSWYRLSDWNEGAASDAFFRDTLNYSVDPCVDFSAFTCSMWKPMNDFSVSFAMDMSETHMKRMAELLLHGRPTFNASAMPATFLRKCMHQAENLDSLRAVRQFARELGIPWPYVSPSFNHSEYVYPLHVIFELSIKWGINTWFSVVLRHSQTSVTFYIDTTTVPSEWLSFVHMLEENNARESYYRHFCELYGVDVPERATLQEALAVEKYVLVTLDSARWSSPQKVLDETTTEIERRTRNVTLEEWVDVVLQFAPNVTEPEAVHFYVTNMKLIDVIDEIFYFRSRDEIMEHLAWWFAQQYALLGSSRALLVIAGSSEKAESIKAVECYKIAAEKFGLLLNVESAASLFSAIDRQQLSHFFNQLVELAIKFVHLMPWNDDGHRYVSQKFDHLLVTLWPDDMTDMDDVLLLKYSDFLVSDNSTEPSFMDYWVHASQVLQALSDSEYEWMQHKWLTHDGRLFVHVYWTNQLTVQHAAMTPPLYYSNNTDLQGANFGGLGASFLANVLDIFKPSVVYLETKRQIEHILSRHDMERFLEESACGLADGSQVQQFLALSTAWHAFKLTSLTADQAFDRNKLEIESFRQTRSFSDEQVFFLTYCRSLCKIYSNHTCNDVLRHFGGFAEAFHCKSGASMRARDTCGLLKPVNATPSISLLS
ncbi:neprilysin-11 [Dermacentor silvarum]|uniref:neprilysin-11 n=1 Tax=Dermacentor silvarum TaxID=543639 RepID=UPI0018981881|nr:neprilysin-11 [Dermacentor silvarum]